MVALVIDTNRLDELELKMFLQASKRNMAVLTDYLAMEGMNSKSLASFIVKMSAFGQYSDQVLILKSTQVICKLSGRVAGLRRRFVHKSLTASFPIYMRKLAVAGAGNAQLLHELDQMKDEGREQIDRMLADAEKISLVFDELALGFDKEARNIIVGGGRFSSKMIAALIPAVMEVASDLFRSHPARPEFPSYEELPNTFIFRNALCCYLVALRRAANGSTKMKGVRFDRIRNDMIDTHFASYATYFDGLMTADAGAAWLYAKSKEIILKAFG